MLITSTDEGKSWSKPMRLPQGILGPIKNKPIELADGTLLCGSSTEHQGWRLHVEFTKDHGRSWNMSQPLNDGKEFGAIQPSFLTHGDGTIQLLCRSRTSGKILTASSKDNGKTWSPLKNTELPNPNSGIDATTLKDGRHLVVYNHTPKGRSPLNIALSTDGQTWKQALALETQPGEYSYPAVLQTADGKVHVTYTWKREKVKHVVIDPSKMGEK
jgi:alpha-L-rhamnosidase